jgi:signal peptidase I
MLGPGVSGINRIDAKWDGKYKYGKELNIKREKILPGDIIQFRDVKVQYREGNTIYTETMAHHTAIVYRVLMMVFLSWLIRIQGFQGELLDLSASWILKRLSPAGCGFTARLRNN